LTSIQIQDMGYAPKNWHIFVKYINHTL